jgi:hypothetical protein
MLATSDGNHLRSLCYGHLERKTAHPSCSTVEQHPLSMREGEAMDDHLIGRSCRKWERSSLNVRETSRLACDQRRIDHLVLRVGAAAIMQKVDHVKNLVPWGKAFDAWTDYINHT